MIFKKKKIQYPVHNDCIKMLLELLENNKVDFFMTYVWSNCSVSGSLVQVLKL